MIHSSFPVANLFAWENWHLPGYLAIFILLLHRHQCWSNELSLTGTTLGLGGAGVSRGGLLGQRFGASIADATTLNPGAIAARPGDVLLFGALAQRDVLRLAGTLT